MKQCAKIAFSVALAAFILFQTVALAASGNAETLPASVNTFTFSDAGVSASDTSGTGYRIEGTSLTVTASGVYAVTGSCRNGNIEVAKETKDVTLVLRGLTLASTETAPVVCKKDAGVTLYVAGTTTLTDAENPANETSADSAVADAFEGAAVKLKSGASLTISGTGALNADGSACKNGIKGGAGASVTVTDGVTVNVTAAANGVSADGGVEIRGGTLNITAGNDGLKADPDDGDTDSNGTVRISGGNITINAQGDAAQGAKAVDISGGVLNVTTFGGRSNKSELGADGSAKGVKSGETLNISGGSFVMDCADDAIHSNNSATVTGGTFQISTGDDAFHAERDLVIGVLNGGGPSLTVTDSYEGLEGARIFLNAGSGDITASDDGVNAATDETVDEIAVYINGGNWIVNAGGDGLDSGGDSRNNRGGYLYVNGGVTEVYGSNNGGNAALDYDSSCVYSGGTLLAVDVTGMNQQPTEGVYVFFGVNGSMGGGMEPGGGGRQRGEGQAPGNPGQWGGGTDGERTPRQRNGGQPPVGTPGQQTPDNQGQEPRFISWQFPGNLGQQPGSDSAAQQSGNAISITQGSAIEIRNGAGDTLYSATGRKNANCVMLCHEKLTAGESYALYVNGSAASTAAATGRTASETRTGVTPETGNGAAPESGNNALSENEPKPDVSNAAFADVTPEAYYYDAVLWAVGRGVTNGITPTLFAPGAECTRAQTVTFLWRAADSPEPVSKTVAFTDIDADSYYYKAVLWAVEQGVTTGTSATAFSPGDTVSRAQAVTFLYRWAGSPAVTRENPFTDVAADAYYRNAVSWAADAGITLGTSATLFSPSQICNRGQIVTFLYRYDMETAAQSVR